MGRIPAHRQAVRVRGRRRHRRVRGDHSRARARRQRGGAPALRAHQRAAVSDARGAERSRSRRRSRDRVALRLPDDLRGCSSFRMSGGATRPHPRLGRDAADSEARGRRAGRALHRREPAASEPDAQRAPGFRGRLRRPAARARGVPRRVARVPRADDRGGWGQARDRRGSLRSRGGGAEGALAARRPGARRRARPVPGAGPDRRRRHVDHRRGLPGRGGRPRRVAARPGGAGVRLLVPPRRAPCEARSRHPRRGAAARVESGHRRRRPHGAPARAPLPAPARSSGRPARPLAGAGRRGDRLDPVGARGARRERTPRRGQGTLPCLARRRRHDVGALHRLRPRARGGLRGARGEEGRLRRDRARRRARRPCSRRTRPRCP